MRKTKVFAMSALCAAITASSLTFPVFAAEDVVYGTMNIPYDKFFAAEGVESEVDAVASATTSKWNNENLTAGTYGSANDDGTGTILGVTYPVAVSRADLDTLGDNNYGFAELKDAPSAYKTVTVNSGAAEFSAVSGDNKSIDGAEASISSESPWGDYVIDVKAINNANGTSDIGTIYGAVLITSDGSGYAMRHLQNIWRDELAWSSGFVTSEPHGNTLDYEDYTSLMGKTVTEIRYITDSGYHSLKTSLYVPVKFKGSVSAADGSSGSGSSKITLEGFPEDYKKTYSVEGITANISDTSVDYKDAMPGEYTLKVSDENGVYADMKATFTLSTDEMPAKFDGTKIVKADGVSDKDFENFIKNISIVSVNGKEYAASGRDSVAVIKVDGTIDYAAKTGGRGEQTPIFNGGEYALVVTSAGYNKTLSFTANQGSSAEQPGNSDTGSYGKGNPGTGVAGNSAAVGAALIAAVAILVSKKKK